jgi:alpha-beta hydrolase superfamily lysophospholipase
MGGLIVQKLAELLDPPAVVAVTPAPPRGIFILGGPALLWAAIKRSPAIVLGRPLLPDKADAVRLVLNRLPADQQESVSADSVPESSRVALEIAVGRTGVDPSRVSCPVLVIAASQDRITPAKVVRKVARRYGAELREYPGFAHMIIMEPGWETVAVDVADWLEKAIQAVG